MNSGTNQPQIATRRQLVFGALALLALWFVLCRQLSGEWSVNEQYSYGWFVPFFAAFLFWLRWDDRPQVDRGGRRSEVRGRKGIAIAIAALVVLFPVRLFEVANPDWRPIDWIHAAAVVALTLLVIWAAGGRAWVRHFAFPVCFILVAVPWITPIEEPIVQGLMRTVAALATDTITLFGVPAQLEGNLIRVSTGLVGVNEACSGVRSLQTSLMIGLLFGELKRLSLAKRCLLVIGAVVLALLANFGRALFLIWIAATESVSAVDRWHDIAGYAIVALVFCGALLLSALLGKSGKTEVRDRNSEVGKQDSPTSDLRPQTSPRFLLSTLTFLLSLSWLLAVEIGVEAWYRLHERGLIAPRRWMARWPEQAKDFRDIHIDETTKRILRFDEGRGATWRIQRSEVGDQKSEGEEAALLYFFRWRPGGNSALLANLHRPDVCLPASGWTQMGDYGIRSYRVTENFSLPFRHFLFSQSGTPGRQRFAHAFFCLREDRVRKDTDASLAREEFAQEPSEWSRQERVNLVREGRRHLGQQVMEMVLLTREKVSSEEAETQFGALVQELVEQE
ncbi:MAG: exosortase/archaeosortase family protein [Chthoniobacterales bacterium]